MAELKERSALKRRTVALLGNPNVGKSSVFNALTGLRQKVANYPGVTVDLKAGEVDASGLTITYLDLPGVGSLVPRSEDESITVEVLLGTNPAIPKPDVLLAILDATQLRRGLVLVSQLLEWGLPLVIALNLSDEAKRAGIAIDPARLSEALGGVPVLPTVANQGLGMTELASAITSVSKSTGRPPELTIRGVQGLPQPSPQRWTELRRIVEEAGLVDEEIRARFRFATAVMEQAAVQAPSTSHRQDDKIDRWLLHPVLGFGFLILIMGTVFQCVFRFSEAPMGWIESGIGFLGDQSRALLGQGIFPDLISDGLIAGIGSVLVFLPQILILFFFIGLLEDTGYMTRAGFIADRPLRALGLSGRSFIPLLASFACAVPGILATRTIEDTRERRLAILVLPFMTCSARLPVYAILIGNFVPNETLLGVFSLQGLVLLGLYLFGILLAGLVAAVARVFLRQRKDATCILEMAPYRRPSALSIGLRLWQRSGQFLRRAGTLILAMSVLIWALTAFPRTEAGSPDVASSLAGQFGKVLEPALDPLGFDWRVGIGLVASLAAREVFVSTMTVVYAVEDSTEEGLGAAMKAARFDRDGGTVFDFGAVIALLVFYAVALQCLSTVAVVYRETRSLAFTVGQFVGFTALAYLLSWAARHIALAILG